MSNISPQMLQQLQAIRAAGQAPMAPGQPAPVAEYQQRGSDQLSQLAKILLGGGALGQITGVGNPLMSISPAALLAKHLFKSKGGSKPKE